MSVAKLQGKVAIVTGASAGIGQAIALKLAREGADVAICARNKDRLEATARDIIGLGRKAESFALDVSNGPAVQEMVAAVEKSWGRIDILVNNAGITKDGLVMRMGEEDWDAVLDVNLKSVFLFTKAVCRTMIKQRGGAIINVSSIIGLIGNPGQGNYSASKGGMIAFTKSVAKELASRNIRVNAIAPGYIQTQMTEKIPEDLQKKMLETIPLARYGRPDDIANAVMFLAGEEAAYITGQVLTVDGGMVM